MKERSQMPRRQPPKGYYRATEVEKLLGVSSAMVRIYVQKGEIKYLVPEGMKQGFYLKSDVDKLANKLNAFLSLKEDDKESTRLLVASKEELSEIAAIGRGLFVSSGDNTNRTTYPEWRVRAHEKNPESQYVLKHGEHIIGYATVLPFKQNTDKIDQLLRVELIREIEITADDIEVYEKGKHVNLFIGAIGIKFDIEKEKRTLYGTSLVVGLIDKIVGLGRRGIIIDSVVAIGATRSGIRLLQSFGFSEIPTLRQGQREFAMDMATSGAPVAMQYKRALQESGVLKSGTRGAYYLKMSVDDLVKAKELFDIQYGAGITTFSVAKEEDIRGLYELCVSLWGTRGTYPYELRLARYRKNPKIFYVLKYGGTVVGYSTLMPISERAHDEIIQTGKPGYEVIRLDDILPFTPDYPLSYVFLEIAVRDGVPKPKQYAMHLISGTSRALDEFARQGIFMKKLFATSRTPDGIGISRRLGFKETPLPPKGETLAFELDTKTANSPLLDEYQKLIKEHTKLLK